MMYELEASLIEDVHVLVIGGGHPQLCLIEAFAEIGCRMSVVDDRPACPAHRHTENIISINRYDVDAIETWVATSDITRVASAGADRAVYVAARVAEKFHLPHPLTVDTTLRPMTKGATTAVMTAAGVRCPVSFTGMHRRDFDLRALPYPVVVKPDQGIGQTGVNIAEDRSGAAASIDEAFACSGNAKVTVQEYVHGDEVGINGIVLEGVFHLLTTSYRRSSRIRGGAFGVALQKVYPATENRHILHTMTTTMQRACLALGIDNAPVYAQAILTPDDDLVMIEAMPRLGGGEDPRLVQRATGLDLAKATALLALDRPVDLQHCMTGTPHDAVALTFLTAAAGLVTEISTPAEVPSGAAFDLFVAVDDTVEPLTTSRQRAGYILTTASTSQEALAIAETMSHDLRITTVVDSITK